jgi:hypothetical protein
MTGWGRNIRINILGLRRAFRSTVALWRCNLHLNLQFAKRFPYRHPLIIPVSWLQYSANISISLTISRLSTHITIFQTLSNHAPFLPVSCALFLVSSDAVSLVRLWTPRQGRVSSGHPPWTKTSFLTKSLATP